MRNLPDDLIRCRVEPGEPIQPRGVYTFGRNGSVDFEARTVSRCWCGGCIRAGNPQAFMPSTRSTAGGTVWWSVDGAVRWLEAIRDGGGEPELWRIVR